MGSAGPATADSGATELGVPTGDPAYGIEPLRSGYESVAVSLQGSFGDPEPGEWNARQVAGHVITNAELMCRVVDDVRAGRPARLHGPSDHVPAAVGRCDEMDFGDAAGDLRRAGANSSPGVQP